MRLHGAELGDVVGGGFLEGPVRLLVAVEAAGLQAVERPVGAEQVREVAQVQDVAEHAGDEEERRARAALALVHGDEVLVAPAHRRRGGLRRLSAGGVDRPAVRRSAPRSLAIVGASNSTEIGNSTR